MKTKSELETQYRILSQQEEALKTALENVRQIKLHVFQQVFQINTQAVIADAALQPQPQSPTTN